MYIRRGFTLVEILCVITILAIAALSAVDMFGNSDPTVGVTAAAQSVVADLMYAQNLAITNQSSVYVTFASPANTGGRYTLSLTAGGTAINRPSTSGAAIADFVVTFWQQSSPALSPPGTLLPGAKVVSGYPKVKISGSPTTVTTLGFDFLGQPFNGTGATTNTDVATIQLVAPTTTVATTTITIQAYTGDMTIASP
jgi:prepilin-type N-terminal cleavage/methylation domain-containing protein